jgi:hypothetical protein
MPILPSFLQGIFGKTPEPTEELIKALPPPTKEAPEAQAFQVSSSDIANIQMMGDSAMQAEGHRGLDYDQLKAMARVPLVASIVQTRINQAQG